MGQPLERQNGKGKTANEKNSTGRRRIQAGIMRYTAQFGFCAFEFCRSSRCRFALYLVAWTGRVGWSANEKSLLTFSYFFPFDST